MSGAPLYSGEWQLLSDRPDIGQRKWIMAVDEHNLVVRTETYLPSLVAEANAEDFKASDGKRWGDGQVAARMPLDLWFRDLGEATRQGDLAYKRRYFNNSDNARWRTFKGTI